MVMQLSAKKNAGCLRAPRDFLARLRIAVSCPVGLPWNSLPPPPTPYAECTGGRAYADVKIKISLRFAYPWCTDGAFRALVSAMMKAILFILFDGIYVTSGC